MLPNCFATNWKIRELTKLNWEQKYKNINNETFFKMKLWKEKNIFRETCYCTV